MSITIGQITTTVDSKAEAAAAEGSNDCFTIGALMDFIDHVISIRKRKDVAQVSMKVSYNFSSKYVVEQAKELLVKNGYGVIIIPIAKVDGSGDRYVLQAILV